MTLQMERVENEEGSCVETEIQVKRNKNYKDPHRKDNKLCINVGWLLHLNKPNMLCPSLNVLLYFGYFWFICPQAKEKQKGLIIF